MRFLDKRVVITGGVGGVGRALVKLFALEGARVMFSDGGRTSKLPLPF